MFENYVFDIGLKITGMAKTPVIGYLIVIITNLDDLFFSTFSVFSLSIKKIHVCEDINDHHSYTHKLCVKLR